jgi:hypothetical protein
MKNMNKNLIFKASLMVLFAMFSFAIIPAIAEANYGYNGGYNYGYYSNISNNYEYNKPVQPVTYSVPVYYPVYTPVYTPAYPTLQASCYANTSNAYNSYNNSNSSVRTGDTVAWYANVSGGNGSYSYTWSGSDNLYGSGSTAYKSYYSVGTKYATLSVNSGGQITTVSCNNAINVYEQPTYYNQTYPVPVQVQYSVPISQYQNYQVNSINNLDIGCFADPLNASIDQPVTWSVEVTGGIAPYTYSWTGSEGLSGNQSSIIKYYGTSGEKSAIVSITSADGRTGTRACSNNVTIRKVAVSSTVQAKTQVQSTQQQSTSVNPVTQNPTPSNQAVNNTAAALPAFSLANVPWGFVAVLVIFVLFATVMYLLFNRPKI